MVKDKSDYYLQAGQIQASPGSSSTGQTSVGLNQGRGGMVYLNPREKFKRSDKSTFISIRR